MKTITLQEAYYIISLASAVIIDGDALCYPSLWDLTGEPENQFLYLSWENDGDYNLKFCESDNQQVKVDGSDIFLFDTDADDEQNVTKLTILVPQKID